MLVFRYHKNCNDYRKWLKSEKNGLCEWLNRQKEKDNEKDQQLQQIQAQKQVWVNYEDW